MNRSCKTTGFCIQFKGFTLLELMMVMAIIAISSAIIIPRISSSEGKIFRTQVSTLLATLNYNRRTAVITNQFSEMTLFAYHSSSKIPLKKGDWRSQGADLIWQSGQKKTHNKNILLRFFPQGGATGGTIILRQGKYDEKIQIDVITGKVSIAQSSDKE
jgi:general secretion pathway protein H